MRLIVNGVKGDLQLVLTLQWIIQGEGWVHPK